MGFGTCFLACSKAAIMAGVGFMIVGSPTSTFGPSGHTPMWNPITTPRSAVVGRT